MARPTPPSSRHRIRIGCAGWSIGSAQRDAFDQGESLLARYATRFDMTEVNSSFHRPHRHATWARWAATVPAGFRFSAKLPRTITHDLRLQGIGAALDEFLAQVDGLGEKLGCLLVQLPPSLAYDARIASRFFAMLRRRWSGGVACEPRHRSWFGTPATALLLRHAITRVGADPACVPDAAQPSGSLRPAYWRLHGAPRMYYSDYPPSTLATLADIVRRVAPDAGEAWVVFDNTAHGHAIDNALALRQLLDAHADAPR